MRTLWRSQRAEDMGTGCLFLLPALVVMFVFIFVPILFTLYVSFRAWSPASGIPVTEAPFVGGENYARLLLEPGVERSDFYRAVKNNLYYVMGVVPVQTVLGMLLAVVVNQKFLRGRTFFRTAFYIPAVMSSAALSLIFLAMYQSNGLINQFLALVVPGYEPFNWAADVQRGGMGLFHVLLGVGGITRNDLGPWATTQVMGLTLWDWLSGPSITLCAIMLLNIWATVGTLMLIYLAALQNIPVYLYNSATMDGASPWQAFWYITLPLLRPTTTFVVMVGLIGTWQVFDQIYMISAGGPRKTTLTLAFLIWVKLRELGVGQAAALAFVLFAIISFFISLRWLLTGRFGAVR